MIHASQYSHMCIQASLLCIQASLSFKHASLGFCWLSQHQRDAVKVTPHGFQGLTRSLTT